MFKKLKITHHPFPKDRTLIEKVVRKLVLPPSKKKFFLFGGKYSYKRRQSRLKANFPVRYFLSETLPSFLAFVKNRYIEKPRTWIKYRTTRRFHVLKMRTLEPGYYDTDTRMLHAVFQLLVDYVEVELARMNIDFKGTWKNGRCPEAGVNYLEWEIDDEMCKVGASPTQSDLAKEKLYLYKWWTESRPLRVDPWDTDIIWANKARGSSLDDFFAGNYDPEPGTQAQTLESFYDQEDQEMLERLVVIRKSLWT